MTWEAVAQSIDHDFNFAAPSEESRGNFESKTSHMNKGFLAQSVGLLLTAAGLPTYHTRHDVDRGFGDSRTRTLWF
jgi:hypothetical protein